AALATIGTLLQHPVAWRVLFDLLMIAVCGGIFIVPLYAIMQSRSDRAERARIIAANNILNALFMVLAAVGAGAVLALGFGVGDVFLSVAAANLAVAVYICGLLPDETFKSVLR